MHRRDTRIGIITVLLVLASRTLVLGVLFDPGFGTGGKVEAPVSGAAGFEGAAGVVLEPGTGRIFLATRLGELLAYLPDGMLDGTFGTAGRVDVIDPTARRLTALVRQPADGKLVAVGIEVTGPQETATATVIRRYDAQGMLDAGFGTAGEVVTTQPVRAFAALVQPDGAIVVAGRGADETSPGAITRFLSDGSPDPGFGAGGTVVLNALTGPGSIRPAALLIVAGKLVVGGVAQDDYAIVRYEADGTPDASFGTGGLVKTTVADPFESGINALVQQTDGKLVAVGGYITTGAVRYLPDGTLDASYGTGGILYVHGAGATTAVLDDDAVVMTDGPTIFRVRTDGTLDPDFAPCLVAFQNFVTAAPLTGIVRQADGKLVVAGGAGYAVARLLRYTTGTSVCQPAAAGRAKLSVHVRGFEDSSRAVSWKWKSSADVAQSDFGNPLLPTGDGYLMCIVEDGPPAVFRGYVSYGVNGSNCAAQPADPNCWQATAAGYQVNRQIYRGSGLRMTLQAGVSGRGRIAVKSKGVDSGLVPKPPYGVPLTVRFDRGGSPFCWESHFTTASHDDSKAFTAKSD
jgi:uncharacterized delta-60 repeat protein